MLPGQCDLAPVELRVLAKPEEPCTQSMKLSRGLRNQIMTLEQSTRAIELNRAVQNIDFLINDEQL